MRAIDLSGASRVLVTHGFSDVVARVLRERGLAADVLTTRFVGEAAPDDAAATDPTDLPAGDDNDAEGDNPTASAEANP